LREEQNIWRSPDLAKTKLDVPTQSLLILHKCKGVKAAAFDEGRWKVTIILRHHWYVMPWTRRKNRERIRDWYRPRLSYGVLVEFV